MKGILEAKDIQRLLLQKYPILFVDRILEIVGEERIIGIKNFTVNEPFFVGHFPGNPITPGVILVETMAQASVVAQGIYLYALEFGVEEIDQLVTVFTDANVEFTGPVLPGERVTTTGRVSFFRRKKLRAEVELRREDGHLVCSGGLSGMGIRR